MNWLMLSMRVISTRVAMASVLWSNVSSVLTVRSRSIRENQRYLPFTLSHQYTNTLWKIKQHIIDQGKDARVFGWPNERGRFVAINQPLVELEQGPTVCQLVPKIA